MVTKAQKDQLWANSKRNYQPLHAMTPTPVKRVKLRLVEPENMGVMEWVVQSRDKHRKYAPGIPATDYLVSLWFDLCEEREKVAKLEQAVSKQNEVIQRLKSRLGVDST